MAYEVSEEVVEKAKKRLAKLTTLWPGGVCYGEILDINGDECLGGHQACHSWLTDAFKQLCGVGQTFDFRFNKYKEGAQNFLTLTCHSHKYSRATPEATDAIILWLAQESPFSQFVVNRDDEKSLTEDGAIILCGPDGASPAQAMWMCKILRYCTEGSTSIDTWYTLYKAGVNPLLATLVCTHITCLKGAEFRDSKVCDHVAVFSRDADKVNLVDLTQGVNNPKAIATSSLFAVNAKGLVNPVEKIRDFCRPFKKPDGWGGFVRGNGADKESLIKNVLEWQQEIEKGIEPPKMSDSSSVYLDLDL